MKFFRPTIRFLRSFFFGPPKTTAEIVARNAFAELHPDKTLVRSNSIADEPDRWVIMIFYSGGRPTPYTIFFVDKETSKATEHSKPRHSKYAIKNYR